MKKLLVVLASVLLIAGTASAGIGVGGGWGVRGLEAQVEMGLGGMDIQGEVIFWPYLSFGGNVILRPLPSLMDGKITPYFGGGAIFQPATTFMTFTTQPNILWVGGKGGVEYKLTDNIIAYGGYGFYYPIILETGWLAWPSYGPEGGIRFMLVP